MKSNTASIMMGLALLTASTHAIADNSPDARSFDKRFYLGAGTGLSRLEPECQNCPNVDVGDNGGPMFGVFAGLDLTKHLSLEAYYSDLNEATLENAAGTKLGTIGYTHYGISALGYLWNSRNAADYSDGYDDEGFFRREGFSAYGRIGFGKMNNTADLTMQRENDTQVILGLGGEYGWDNGLALRGEFVNYDKDAKALQLSLLKRFGSANPYIVPAAAPAAIPAQPLELPEVKPSQGFGFELPVVHFPHDQSTLLENEKGKLDNLSETLKPIPGLKLEVRGHTDSDGSHRYNQGLSESRASAVKRYLEEKGTPPDQLIPRGYGENLPVDTNDTDAGKQNNRRVDFEIFKSN